MVYKIQNLQLENTNGFWHKIQTEELPDFFVEIGRRFIGCLYAKGQFCFSYW